MWLINNQTAYAAERTWLRDMTGAHVWMIAVRATFAIADSGQLSLADEQAPPLWVAQHAGAPENSSLLYEADLGYFKPSTDVTLLGSAYAPGGRAAPRVVVEMRMRDISKAVEVFGERVYTNGPVGLAMSAPVPFVSQRIRYEAAFGGTDEAHPDPTRHVRDARNPVGRGVASEPRHLWETPAHTLEYPGRSPESAGPAGFGPVACHWLPRRSYAGTYDDAWVRDRKPLLPADFDPRFALCAPRDQLVPGYLRGGEVIELIHLTPSGRLRLEVPTIRLSFTTHIDGRRVTHEGHYASVIIEPDERRLSLVLETSLPVRARDADYLDFTVIEQQ